MGSIFFRDQLNYNDSDYDYYRLGMAKYSTGLGLHGVPPQMGKFFNNFWGMGWGVGEK